MLDFDFTFLWTLINLGLLFVFLKLVLFKRVGDFMDKRNAAIQDDIKAGEAARTKGELFEKEQRYLYNTAAAKKAAVLQEARKQASRDAEDILERARVEAARIVAEAASAADREADRVRKELHEETVELAMTAARKVLEETVDEKKNRTLIDRFLRVQGAA